MKNSTLIILFIFISVNVLASCGTNYNEASGSSDTETVETQVTTGPDLQKATTLIYQKKWDQAIKLLLGYTKEYPKNGESWYYLASAYHGKQEYSKAITANEKAVQHSQQMKANAYYNLACAYSLTNNKDKAEMSLKMAQQNGFLNYDLLRNDTDIELLRKSGIIDLPKSHKYKRITHNGIEVKYHVILPDNYNQSQAYPAMLAYPPGSQKQTSADWALSEFWGDAAKKKNWIIIVPVAPNNGWINHPSHHALNDLLKTVKAKHKIEGGKFHMVGFEGGARPAATFALMSKQYFQSLTLVSSYAFERWDDEDLESFKIMPVKQIVGANDKHGVEIAYHAQTLFKKFNVKSELEVVPNEGRDLPSLRNAALIDKIDGFVR